MIAADSSSLIASSLASGHDVDAIDRALGDQQCPCADLKILAAREPSLLRRLCRLTIVRIPIPAIVVRCRARIARGSHPLVEHSTKVSLRGAARRIGGYVVQLGR